MKNKYYLLILFLTISFTQENKFFDQFSIGIGANNFQTAKFKKDINAGTLTYGFGFFRFSNETTMKEGNEEFSTSIKANVFMPNFGFQKHLGSYNRIDTFGAMDGYLIFPTLDLTIDGDQGDTDDFEKEIVDLLDLFGMKVSYGLEYKFNEQLSLVTNVGYNFILHDMETSSTSYSEEWNGDYYEEVSNTVKTTINTNIITSFTSLSLNFRL